MFKLVTSQRSFVFSSICALLLSAGCAGEMVSSDDEEAVSPHGKALTFIQVGFAEKVGYYRYLPFSADLQDIDWSLATDWVTMNDLPTDEGVTTAYTSYNDIHNGNKTYEHLWHAGNHYTRSYHLGHEAPAWQFVAREPGVTAASALYVKGQRRVDLWRWKGDKATMDILEVDGRVRTRDADTIRLNLIDILTPTEIREEMADKGYTLTTMLGQQDYRIDLGRVVETKLCDGRAWQVDGYLSQAWWRKVENHPDPNADKMIGFARQVPASGDTYLWNCHGPVYVVRQSDLPDELVPGVTAQGLHLHSESTGKLIEGSYMALGDSYSSGEGIPEFEEGTDQWFGNACHRSKRGWASWVSSLANGGDLSFHACSGAVTADVMSEKQYNTQDPQIQYLQRAGSDPALLTISIGGNDAGFGAVLEKCILAGADCQTQCMIKDGNRCLRTVQQEVDARRSVLAGHSAPTNFTPSLDAGMRELSEVYKGIITELGRGTQTTIRVLGYPPLMSAHLVRDRGSCRLLFTTYNEAQWIDEQGRIFNEMIRDEITEAKDWAASNGYGAIDIAYVDLETPFRDHGMCQEDESKRWLNKIVLPQAVHSAHPNSLGAKEIARAVLESL